MPEQQIPKSGGGGLGTGYGQGMRLLMPESTNAAAITLAPLAAANPLNPYTEIRALSGIVEMGSADALWLSPLGTGVLNETYTLFVSAYQPLVVTDASGIDRIVGWTQHPISAWTVTLSNVAVGAVPALVPGVDATDVVPFNVQPAGSTNAWNMQDAALNTLAYRVAATITHGWQAIVVPTWNAPFVRLQSRLEGTAADSALVLGRPIRGWFSPVSVQRRA